ncbi:hypothetical protein [Bacillus sp. NPDC094106]|uniref:hypothetical protein n=1 Tax=Bacillus sp. NPDC094106 TaxID=3363949 RepID=UPI003808F5C2
MGQFSVYFHFTNGTYKKCDIESESHAELIHKIEESKWFEDGECIINLENVTYIKIKEKNTAVRNITPRVL